MTNQTTRRSALKTFGLAAGTALLSATGPSRAMAADPA
ncbi:secreted protein [Paraburkholderia sp. BL23I1N1]|nr:secreted protein [Paraburkholderia sp. BL23I1N1]